jgi:Uma2 family endonuclease
MAIIAQRCNTDQFEHILALPAHQGRLLELINGEVKEKMPTEQHGIIALRIGGRLQMYVEEQGLGQVATKARHISPSIPGMIPSQMYPLLPAHAPW